MKLRTAKRAHSLIEKRNDISENVVRLGMVLDDPFAKHYIKPSHVAELLMYYEMLLDRDLGKVNKQIERLK